MSILQKIYGEHTIGNLGIGVVQHHEHCTCMILLLSLTRISSSLQQWKAGLWALLLFWDSLNSVKGRGIGLSFVGSLSMNKYESLKFEPGILCVLPSKD